MGWNSDDWKGLAATIGRVAPALGTILGGPVGGALGTGVSILASTLGVEETPDAIQRALVADPEAYRKIKQAELDHETELQKLVYETVQAGYQHDASIVESLSKADSSGHSTRPKIALMMAWMLAIPFVGIGIAMTFVISSSPDTLKDLWPVIGTYFGIPLALLRMYFGDLRKEKAIDKGQQVDFGVIGSLLKGKK